MLSRDNYQENHHHRKRLVEDRLLQYKGMIKVSDRNKKIVEEYTQGSRMWIWLENMSYRVLVLSKLFIVI